MSRCLLSDAGSSSMDVSPAFTPPREPSVVVPDHIAELTSTASAKASSQTGGYPCSLMLAFDDPDTAKHAYEQFQEDRTTPDHGRGPWVVFIGQTPGVFYLLVSPFRVHVFSLHLTSRRIARSSVLPLLAFPTTTITAVRVSRKVAKPSVLFGQGRPPPLLPLPSHKLLLDVRRSTTMMVLLWALLLTILGGAVSLGRSLVFIMECELCRVHCLDTPTIGIQRAFDGSFSGSWWCLLGQFQDTWLGTLQDIPSRQQSPHNPT